MAAVGAALCICAAELKSVYEGNEGTNLKPSYGNVIWKSFIRIMETGKRGELDDQLDEYMPNLFACCARYSYVCKLRNETWWLAVASLGLHEGRSVSKAGPRDPCGIRD